MNRQIALAYGVAGLAVAIAFVTVVSTTLGFSEAAPAAPVAESPIASVDPAALADFPSQRNAAEVVYVDENGNPVDERLAQAGGRRHDDDRWEDDDDDDDEDDDDDDDDDHHGHRDRDDD